MGSGIYDEIQEDLKLAMKSKEGARVTALRTLVAGIKDATVNAGKDVTDDSVIDVVNKALKQRADSIEQFAKGGRDDLVAKEKAEAEWLGKYRPEQLGEQEIEDLAKAAIDETGAEGKGDMGKVMSVLMPQVKGRADGRMVKDVVMRLLG